MEQLQAKRWLVLILLGAAQLMVTLDLTIVNVALPSAQKALHFSAENRQWSLTAHALSFGSLLLGDLWGRKWTLIAGLIGFAIASAIGVSPSPSGCSLAPARCKACSERCWPRPRCRC